MATCEHLTLTEHDEDGLVCECGLGGLRLAEELQDQRDRLRASEARLRSALELLIGTCDCDFYGWDCDALNRARKALASSDAPDVNAQASAASQVMRGEVPSGIPTTVRIDPEADAPDERPGVGLTAERCAELASWLELWVGGDRCTFRESMLVRGAVATLRACAARAKGRT